MLALERGRGLFDTATPNSAEKSERVIQIVKESCLPIKPDRLDIKRIRTGYNLTQEQFAAMLGISVRTLRNWEQGWRVPEGPAMVLLRVADKHLEAVRDAVRH
jgi:DNA-binding transcriptional regulator YiaG